MFFSSNDLKQDWIRVEDVVLNEETSGVDKKKIVLPTTEYTVEMARTKCQSH